MNLLSIQTWLAGNALKYGGLVAMCAVIWLHGCHYGEDRQQAITDKLRVEFNTFVATTKAEGEMAEAAKVAKEKSDKALKEKIDAQYKFDLAESRDHAARLRRDRAARSYLPETTAAAGSPDDDITFDRAELERSIQRLDERVSAIVAKGDEEKAKLDAAVKWAAQWAAGEKDQGGGLKIPKPSKPSEPTATD